MTVELTDKGIKPTPTELVRAGFTNMTVELTDKGIKPTPTDQ